MSRRVNIFATSSRFSSLEAYSASISESKVYEAYVVDSTGQVSETARLKVNIMPGLTGIKSSYQVVGRKYPIFVDTAQTGSTYGTDVYCATSSVSFKTSSVHAGVRQLGEEKLLIIGGRKCYT